MQPDYSRQQLLKEIGAAGQALLANSRVLVVGAGGLGSPVLEYLSGAGVGHLTIVDPDRLDASNLHRQPLFRLDDVGRQKAQLAKAAVLAINPSIEVTALETPFGADNALQLVRDHDLTIDCTDNFRSKYLINDAAVLSQKPAVFASVYQYEGQLQVYQPTSEHACLRCLWPDALKDGLVGNCAEAGVLGPVPGVLGSLQALMSLKILLKIRGQLAGELMLLDLMSFTTFKIKAQRRKECQAPGCTLIKEIAGDSDNLEIQVDSLAEALAQGLNVIDIREADEIAARPSGVSAITMSSILKDPSLLPSGENIALLCASGKRSLATARELRRRGINVHSLAGGLAKVRA